MKSNTIFNFAAIGTMTVALLFGRPAISEDLVSAPPPQAQPPQEFTRNQLLQIAINQNFLSRIQWAKLRESRLQARLAALNLLPHVSINTITRLIVPTPESIARSAGDLLPFLLPTRWFQVKQRKALTLATFDGWLLSKADAGFAVEDMFYTTLAQVRAIRSLQSEYTYVNSVYKRVKILEQSQIKQVGASDDILKILQRIELSISQLQTIVLSNFQALSEMSGFDSPQIVQGIKETAEVNQTPDQIKIPDRQTAETNAITKSLELEQMAHWRTATREDKKARRFMWLDPQGDSEGGLGPAFGTYLRIDDARDQQINAQIDLERAQLRERIDQAIVGQEAARQEYHQSIAAQDTERRRIARYINNMDLGINFEMASLVEALQSLVNDQIDIIQTSIASLSGQARLERLQLIGPYSDIHNVEKLWPIFQKALDRDKSK